MPSGWSTCSDYIADNPQFIVKGFRHAGIAAESDRDNELTEVISDDEVDIDDMDDVEEIYFYTKCFCNNIENVQCMYINVSILLKLMFFL